MSANAVKSFVGISAVSSIHDITECNPVVLHISLAQTYTQAQTYAAEREAARTAHCLPMGPVWFVVVEEKGGCSISVGSRRRSSTSLKETVDCFMHNSKRGKYVMTGRPWQNYFTCLCVAQAKLAEKKLQTTQRNRNWIL